MVAPQSALIYLMVLVSASDGDMTDAEFKTIGDIVQHLPVFRGYDPADLPATARDCAELLSDADGLDKVFDLIVTGLSDRLRETAYVLACEVAAADGRASQEELRILEMTRHRLEVGRLAAAAIERSTRARYTSP